eukprot:scaffold176248_cov18-Tisochrysis_lutea.AAC.1
MPLEAIRSKSSQALAFSCSLRELPDHPCILPRSVERVHYPGLPSSPSHALASKLFTAAAASLQLLHSMFLASNNTETPFVIAGNPKGGYGGVFSFELKGGQRAADIFQAALKIGFVAPSLGGVETLVG